MKYMYLQGIETAQTMNTVIFPQNIQRPTLVRIGAAV